MDKLMLSWTNGVHNAGSLYITDLYADMADNLTTTDQMDATTSCSSCNGSSWTSEGPVADSGGVRTRGRAPVMSVWAQLTWTILFGLMLFTAVMGNVIVMWIVLAHRRMRTVTNYFLVNLSLADLLMALLNCLFNFIYMLHRDWWFGSIYCRISNCVATLTVSASVFTLTAITFDRYLAIVRPLKPRMSKSSAHLILMVIWFGSMTLALPAGIYSTTIRQATKDYNETHCIMVWPDGRANASFIDKIYNMLLFLLTYLVPMLTMMVGYTVMGRELWGSKTIGELSQRQLDGIRSKRKVVRMFILIMVIFGLCWLPYHAYFIYVNFNSKVMYSKYIQHYYLGFYWLAMSNSIVNPLIYYWMNARFRQYFKEAVLVWRCVLIRRPTPGRDTPPLVPPDSFSRSRSDDLAMRLNNTNSSSSRLNNKFEPAIPCTVCQCCLHMSTHGHHLTPSLKHNNLGKVKGCDNMLELQSRRRNLVARQKNIYMAESNVTPL